VPAPCLLSGSHNPILIFLVPTTLSKSLRDPPFHSFCHSGFGLQRARYELYYCSVCFQLERNLGRGNTENITLPTIVPLNWHRSNTRRREPWRTMAAGTAVNAAEQNLHIRISTGVGKCAFHAVQWMAPKTVPTRAMMPNALVWRFGLPGNAQNEDTEVEDTGACPPRENSKKAMASRSKRGTRTGIEGCVPGSSGDHTTTGR
jgi:hypothetical protein